MMDLSKYNIGIALVMYITKNEILTMETNLWIKDVKFVKQEQSSGPNIHQGNT